MTRPTRPTRSGGPKRSCPSHAAAVLLAALVLGILASPLARATDVIRVRPRPGDRFPMRDGRVDHSAFDTLLRRYVDERGLVDYRGWKRDGRAQLARYLERMAAAHPATFADRHERMAYWINVYNALTLHGMLRFYPTRSIRDHVSHLFGFHFWKDVRIVVEDREISVDAIEHEILRPLGDPRIHFAINCASLGCPPLRREAYRGVDLDAQLDDNVRRTFLDPNKFRLDRARHRVSLIRILDWFGEDFGPDDRDRLRWCLPYLPEDDRRWIARNFERLRIDYLPYDWGINDQASAR